MTLLYREALQENISQESKSARSLAIFPGGRLGQGQKTGGRLATERMAESSPTVTYEEVAMIGHDFHSQLNSGGDH